MSRPYATDHPWDKALPACHASSIGYVYRATLTLEPTDPPAVTLELVSRADSHADRPALHTPEGAFTYLDLLATSGRVATRLLTGRDTLDGARICYLVPPGWAHVVVQWGIWRAGGVGVPLATSHPAAELAYVLDDAEPEAIAVHPSLLDRIEAVAGERRLPLLQTPALLDEGPMPFSLRWTNKPRGSCSTPRGRRGDRRASS